MCAYITCPDTRNGDYLKTSSEANLSFKKAPERSFLFIQIQTYMYEARTNLRLAQLEYSGCYLRSVGATGGVYKGQGATYFITCVY